MADKKWTIECISGDVREVAADYPRIDESGAVWFYAGVSAMQPDRIVACFAPNFWASFAPAQPERTAPEE